MQKNFGKPVEWALVKDHAWSAAQLRKLDVPVSPPLRGIVPNSCSGTASRQGPAGIGCVLSSGDGFVFEQPMSVLRVTQEQNVDMYDSSSCNMLSFEDLLDKMGGTV